MNIGLTRIYSGSDGILSVAYDEKENEVFCSLEHSYNIDGKWIPKIPAGVYTCKRRMSPHFGYEVFQVLDVPNCTFIEIHRGNFESQSAGCILVGEDPSTASGPLMVTNSEVTFNKFMELQDGIDSFLLTVKET